MKLDIKQEEKHVLITVKEQQLDEANSSALKEELVAQIVSGNKNLILDLNEVAICDTEAISGLLMAERSAKKINKSFVVVGVQDAVQRIISISKLEDVLRVLPTVSEAFDYIMMEELEREMNLDNFEE